MYFSAIFKKYYENLLWAFLGDCTKCVDCNCGIMTIFAILILPTQEYGKSFHLPVSSSVPCFNILHFSLIRFFTFLLVYSKFLTPLWMLLFLWHFLVMLIFGIREMPTGIVFVTINTCTGFFMNQVIIK